MSLPPFDGTGWIIGMPGLPGGGTTPPALTLTLTAEPANPAAGAPVVISVTASADPPDPVTLNYTLNGGAPVSGIALTETSPTTWSNSVDTTLLVPGSVYEVWATSGAAESNHVTVTIAATVGALTAFAEAHGIDIPSGAKKAELLTLVQESNIAAPALLNTEEN
jgi:hypothetical protein